jgi:hypothetical protein
VEAAVAPHEVAVEATSHASRFEIATWHRDRQTVLTAFIGVPAACHVAGLTWHAGARLRAYSAHCEFPGHIRREVEAERPDRLIGHMNQPLAETQIKRGAPSRIPNPIRIRLKQVGRRLA